MNFGFKFAPNDYWYSILAYGRDNEGDDGVRVQSIGYYMGFHLPVPIISGLYVEADLGRKTLMTGNKLSNQTEDNFTRAIETRAVMGYRLYGVVSLFAGVAYKQIGDNIKWFKGGETETRPLLGIQLDSLY